MTVPRAALSTANVTQARSRISPGNVGHNKGAWGKARSFSREKSDINFPV